MLKSADPSGLRVDRPAFFQSSELFFSPILFLLILRTLRAWGEVYLLPSPLLGAYTAVARAHSRCCVAEKPM